MIMIAVKTFFRTLGLRPAIIAGLVPLLFLSLFYFYPLTGIFIRSFFDQGSFSLLGLLKVFNSSRMMGIIWFTLWQATLSTLLTLVIALPCAWVMGSFDFRGKKIIMTLATLPFVLPTIVVAAAFQALAGNRGLLGFIDLDGSICIILLAHMFYNFSVILRITSGFWASIGKDMSQAAAMLGANPLQIFFKITLPMLKPAILASSMLVFIFCFASFGVILILGGPSFSTIEVEIYRQAAHLFNLPVASSLSLFQILFTFFMMWIYTRMQRKSTQFIPESDTYSLKKPESPGQKCAVILCVFFIICFCSLPIAALFIKSLWYKGSFSLIYYRELFLNTSGSIFYISPADAISNSLIFAFSTLAMALVVGGCAAFAIKSTETNKWRERKIERKIEREGEEERGRDGDKEKHKKGKKRDDKERHKKGNKAGKRGGWRKIGIGENIGRLTGNFLDPLFMLPLSTSAVTLGFGIIITLDKPPLNLRTSVLLIPIIHTLVAFPFVVRSVLPALRAIPPSLKEAAGMLGASPFKVWLHVELPIIARALSVGAIFAFTVSLGEFGATVFAARPEFTTMPVTIYKFMGQPGTLNYGQAMAVSSLLMLVTAAGFLFIETMRRTTAHEDF